MTEYDYARFAQQPAFDFAGHNLANAAQLNLSTGALLANKPTIRKLRPFGHDNQCELLAVFFAVENLVANIIEVPRDFRNQDDIAATGDAGVQRDPAGVATHYFQHKYAFMAGCCGVESIERVGS